MKMQQTPTKEPRRRRRGSCCFCGRARTVSGEVEAVRRRAGADSMSTQCGLRYDGGRRKLAVALHARDDQVEQAKSELRILEIELLELVVVDLCGQHVGLAAHRRRAPAVGREQADLAEKRARSEHF